MTPEEVETRVIAPIELELLGIPRQTILRSSAKYAIADITIDFEDGTDIYWARQQVAERLAGAVGELPSNVSGGLAPISTPLSDVFMFTIEGGNLSLEERRSLLDWTIRPALRTIPGVADVNALGGLVRTFEVVPDSAALAAAGLEHRRYQRRDRSRPIAMTVPAGCPTARRRSSCALKAPSALPATWSRSCSGRRAARYCALQDVATVGIGNLTRYGAVTKDGRGEAVQGLVLSLRGADASAIVKAVRERLETLKPSLPEGVTLQALLRPLRPHSTRRRHGHQRRCSKRRCSSSFCCSSFSEAYVPPSSWQSRCRWRRSSRS